MLGRIFFSLFSLLILISPNVFAGLSGDSKPSLRPYNEVFDSGGRVRPHYASMMEHLGPLLNPSHAQVRALTQAPLDDKIQIYPIPLVISAEDEFTLRSGVSQRAKALGDFFYDIVSGERRAVSAGIVSDTLIDQAISDEINLPLQQLISFWRGRSRDDVRFFYGPDIVRNEEGRFVVIEDNVGRVGGISDFEPIFNVYSGLWGFTQGSSQAGAFLRSAIQNFLNSNSLSAASSGILPLEDPIALKSPNQRSYTDLPDLETFRELKVAREMVGTVFSDEDMTLRAYPWKAVLNFSDMDFSNRQLFKELSLKKIPFFKGPGTLLLTSKAFNPFMDRLIEFYTGRPAILKTQPSLLVEDLGFLSEPNAKDWVLKRSNGLQGKQVHILDQMTREQITRLRWTIEDDRKMGNGGPVKWIRQKRLYPSVISNSPSALSEYYVDFRWITYANGTRNVLVPRPWSRGLSTLGDGLNNVSRGSFEVVTLLSSCESALRKL